MRWDAKERLCVPGSGKTTLLSILADSMTSMSASSRVFGSVSLDGQPREGLQRGLVAYVPQSDYLLPTLTVRESLWYSAHLRLQASLPPATIQVDNHPLSRSLTWMPYQHMCKRRRKDAELKPVLPSAVDWFYCSTNLLQNRSSLN